MTISWSDCEAGLVSYEITSPVRTGEIPIERIVPDKDSEILFYCNGTRCMRSTDSIRKAKRWGYTNLIWFRGGWKEWSDKRLPMVSE